MAPLTAVASDCTSVDIRFKVRKQSTLVSGSPTVHVMNFERSTSFFPEIGRQSDEGNNSAHMTVQ